MDHVGPSPPLLALCLATGHLCPGQSPTSALTCWALLPLEFPLHLLVPVFAAAVSFPKLMGKSTQYLLTRIFTVGNIILKFYRKG